MADESACKPDEDFGHFGPPLFAQVRADILLHHSIFPRSVDLHLISTGVLICHLFLGVMLNFC